MSNIKTGVNNSDCYTKPAVCYIKPDVSNTDCYIKSAVSYIKTDVSNTDIYIKTVVIYIKTGVSNTDCYIQTALSYTKSAVSNIKTAILRLDSPVVFVRETKLHCFLEIQPSVLQDHRNRISTECRNSSHHLHSQMSTASVKQPPIFIVFNLISYVQLFNFYF